jgi:mRNA interferase RelE/StbE
VDGGPRVADEGRHPYEVRLHPEAARAYRRLHPPLRDRITTAIDALALEPRPADSVKLVGRGDYRVRVGDYRIVYAVDDDKRLVIVARIAQRREVYRRYTVRAVSSMARR